MELKYIWVKEFNNIKELGFNFNHSGNHSFSYDGENFEIKEKLKAIIGFGPNIKSVTAIAGENGSGKSSLCEIILEAIATMQNGAFSFNIPFEGIVCIDNYLFYHKNLTISKGIIEKSGYNIVEYNESPLEPEEKWFNDFAKTKFIYYSNVLDWRSDLRNSGLENISTQYLMSDVLWSYKDEEYNGLFPFYREDAYRIANFYLNFHEDCPFTGPQKIRISPNYSGNNRFLKLDYYTHTFKGKEYLDEYQDYILTQIYQSYWFKHEDRSNEVELKDEEIIALTDSLYRLNLLKVICRDKLPEDSELIRKYLFEKGDAEEIFDKGKEIKNLLEIFNILINQGEFVTKFRLSRYASSEERTEWRHHLLNFLIENNNENRTLLREFIALEEEILRDDRENLMRINDYFFDSGNSSGEHSFLVLFARIFEILNRKKDYSDIVEEYIVLLDEPEIGYHPAWKKKLLKWLLNFLNSDFHDYKFQLIITSHSPYLLSDLPSENVMLLKKGVDSKTEIVDSSTRKTFGANIHELLSDSFFLKDGLIGDFAMDIINQLICYLKGNQINEQGNLESQKLIEIIGEPILRNKLQQMLNDRRSIDEKVKWHQAEIEKLNSKK
ncbi:hypothetical protein EO244_14105 [Ancylomarina salipaludis]|uniref:ATPase AAA-type core domain-containing protein n=1 Tax=Ancylomarina salipaludis TaxID=2501299 RepID=A0A4Q1JIP3_9BACT|nr:AAA family ATPase [Ancylomarina salipaludis]RXQ89496.1 hypothetical protein EO244_14105 [Ancylomarina salipaludis]